MALGGVATGNIKAMEALRVAGNINNNGLMWMETDREAITGKIIWVVAVLEVSSVMKVINSAMDMMRKMG